MVERVAVIFFNADNVPLEKFVFKLAMNLSYGSAVEEVDVEFSLRSFLIKLSISESLTKKLPPGKCEYSHAANTYVSLFLVFLWLNCTFNLSTMANVGFWWPIFFPQ